MNARQVEIAVAQLFGYRLNIIVPNIGWGFFSYLMEADLLIVRPSGWAVEVEIKVSANDIKRDLKKRRHLFDKYIGSGFYSDTEKIRQKFFAVPESLARDNNIPASAGIISVNDKGYAYIIRPAQINKKARKLTEVEIRQVLRLGCMRIWTLKETLQKQTQATVSVKGEENEKGM